ncbi:hypothetical protein CHELA17_60485 [Chelatococcus asaccharovorans]|nr:hypothetical protein CHELA17_60485 [Chelatococcus asaccharovorans]
MNLTFELELDDRRDSHVKFAPLGQIPLSPTCAKNDRRQRD